MKKVIFLSFLMLSMLGFSQVTTSKIKGTVKDAQGQPLLGANIVVLHVPTGTTSGSDANISGKYTVPNLRVGGPYKVTISYVGFKSKVVDDIFLTLGKTTTVDATLREDGEQLETVVVKASKNNIFDSDRTGAQTSVSATQLKSLPTISRSAEDFTRLEPTASGGSFGGRNDQFNNFSLDGSIFNNPFGLDAATPGGQTGSQPISLDAIEQISVSTAPYDVTLSGFTGASVDAVTKSGTNEFKGTFYGYYRNDAMTGGKVKGEKVFKGKLDQQQFGASIGGPLIENKLFFFANIERDKRTDLGQAWAPNTGSGAINESRVLKSDLEKVRNALLGLGYDPGAYEGFMHNAGSIKGLFKLDWNINNDHRASFVYNFLDAFKQKPAHPTALANRGPNYNTLQFRNAGYQMNNKINSFLIELNSKFGDKISNKLQVGYTQFDDDRTPFSKPMQVINILKGGSPYIIAGHEPFSINNVLNQKVYQVTNNLNYYVGNHTITAGLSFEKFMFENSFNLTGYEHWGPTYKGLFGAYASVDEFLDNLDGLKANKEYAESQFKILSKNGAGNDGGWKLSKLNVGQLAFYLQDEWEMSDNFKLTYGVRFDKPLYFDTSDLIQEFIDTKNGATRDNTKYYNPNTNELAELNSTTLPSDKILISPRIGFNWDALGNSELQIRGGSGLFTGRLPFVWIGNQVSGADDNFFQLVDPEFQFPQVWRSSLGVDYRFKNGLIATVDASYTKDMNGAHVQNWGFKKPTGKLKGVDKRVVYEDSDKLKRDAYVFTNSDKGRALNLSVKLQKTFKGGFFTSLAYNYLDSRDVNSIEAEITGDAFQFNPANNNLNDDVLSYSKYGDKHRIIGVVSKKFTYGKDNKWSTTLSAFAEVARGGRFTYIYGGNINNDGRAFTENGKNNDLLYVPTEKELEQMNFVEGKDAYNEYIKQDEYLSSIRGQYVQRYAPLSPWRSRVDFKLMQDYNFEWSGRKNTLQFTVDILNIGNMLNSDWGVVQQVNNIQPVEVKSVNNGIPTYKFNPKLKKTFGYDSSLNSRWQMQVGLRYIF